MAHSIRPRFERKKIELRSEEHTSELQSQSNLVCRLLLEKKKASPRTARRTARIVLSRSRQPPFRSPQNYPLTLVSISLRSRYDTHQLTHHIIRYIQPP